MADKYIETLLNDLDKKSIEINKHSILMGFLYRMLLMIDKLNPRNVDELISIKNKKEFIQLMQDLKQAYKELFPTEELQAN